MRNPPPTHRPNLRIVDSTVAPQPSSSAVPGPVPLLGRMIEAAAPGDFEALVLGLIIAVMLLTLLVVADNFTLIATWLFA